MPERALWVLDLTTRANAKVYEDEDYRSYAVDELGHVHDVTREVDRLLSHGAGCLAHGRWSPVGHKAKTVRRMWTTTPQGRLVLIKAGRIRRPGELEVAS